MEEFGYIGQRFTAALVMHHQTIGFLKMNLKTRRRSSGNYPNISLQGMSTATGTLDEGYLGALNVIPQLI